MLGVRDEVGELLREASDDEESFETRCYGITRSPVFELQLKLCLMHILLSLYRDQLEVPTVDWP